MKLYEVPRNTWVKVLKTDKVPPGAPQIEQEDVVKFHHVDGMYSYCTMQDGQKCHLAAWTEVEIVTKGCAHHWLPLKSRPPKDKCSKCGQVRVTGYLKDGKLPWRQIRKTPWIVGDHPEEDDSGILARHFRNNM